MAVSVDQASLGTPTSAAGALGTVSMTTTQAIAAGGYVVVGVSWFGAQTITGATVDGNAATILKQGKNGSFSSALIGYRSASGLASGKVITATFSDSSTIVRTMGAMSFLGVDATVPALTVTGPTNGSLAAWATASATLHAGGALVAQAMKDGNATSSNTPAAGSTECYDVSTDDCGNVLSYRIEATAGTFTVGGTWNTATTNVNVAVLLIPAGGTAAYDAEVMADAPWHFSDLNDPSGAFLDYSGNVRPLTASGSPTYAQGGPSGAAPAVLFPSGVAASAASAAQVATSAATVEAWFYYGGTPPAAQTPIAGFTRTVSTHDKLLYIDTAGKVGWFVNNGSGQNVVSASALSTGWHHVVGSVGAAGMKLRVDKVQVGFNAGVTSSFTGSAQSAVLRPANNSPFNGTGAVKVAKFAVYTTQLSDTRTDAHFDAMPTTSTVSGTAAGTQAGTGTAVAKVKIPATAAGTQAGTGAAVALVKIPATAAGTQAGSGSAVGVPKVLATAAGTQAGTGSAAGTVSAGTVTGTASGTQAGTGAAIAIRTVHGTASSSGAAAGSAAGLVKVSGTAAATNGGTGSAIAIHTVYGTAAGVQAGVGSAIESGYVNPYGRVPKAIPGPLAPIDDAEERVPVDAAEARIPIP